VAPLTDHLMRALPEWSLAPVVDSLIALRGIDKLAAIVLLAELGDISRFESPKQLMGFLGLVPHPEKGSEPLKRAILGAGRP
jgi:transposase